MNKEKPAYANTYPIGFRITRILTDYMCPKTSQALVEFLVISGAHKHLIIKVKKVPIVNGHIALSLSPQKINIKKKVIFLKRSNRPWREKISEYKCISHLSKK
jgi:hypothetical protein